MAGPCRAGSISGGSSTPDVTPVAGDCLCNLARHLDGFLADSHGITGRFLNHPGQLVSLLTNLRTALILGMATSKTGHLARQRAGQRGGLLADTRQITGGQLDLTRHLAGLLTDLTACRLFRTHG